MTEPSGGASRFLVDKLFPLNGLHLIFGPPRSGTSTLLAQICDDWYHAREVFGQPSYPRPFAYIACSCSLELLRAHFEDLGIDHSQIPHASLWDGRKREDQTIGAVVAEARKKEPHCQVVFLDGLLMLCQRGNTAILSDATNFLVEIRREMLRERVTIIATMPGLKNPGVESSLVSRMYGSPVFSSAAGTLVSIESPSPSDPKEPQRLVTLFPHGDAPTQLLHIFDDSRLIPYSPADAVQPELDAWLSTLTPGDLLTTQQAIQHGATLKLSKRTVMAWLRASVELGRLRKAKRGEYVVVEPQKPA